MAAASRNVKLVLEISLIVVVLGLAALFYEMAGFKIVVLNLFYLPIVLAGFFLGRYRAGALAVFCVIAVSIITILDLRSFATFSSPVVVALAALVWGAALGLTAILVGTLSDERNQKIHDLHEAYVGVVEVLSKYLQSANPRLQQRSERIVALSQQVGTQLRLAPQEIDDIRVAALLHDLENVEVTSRAIRKAIDDLEQETPGAAQFTFNGTELAHSLGAVLKGALPLLLEQNRWASSRDDMSTASPIALQGQIIQAARTYIMLRDELEQDAATPEEIVARMQRDEHARFEPSVLTALYRAASTRQESAEEQEPAWSEA